MACWHTGMYLIVCSPARIYNTGSRHIYSHSSICCDRDALQPRHELTTIIMSWSWTSSLYEVVVVVERDDVVQVKIIATLSLASRVSLVLPLLSVHAPALSPLFLFSLLAAGVRGLQYSHLNKPQQIFSNTLIQKSTKLLYTTLYMKNVVGFLNARFNL